MNTAAKFSLAILIATFFLGNQSFASLITVGNPAGGNSSPFSSSTDYQYQLGVNSSGFIGITGPISITAISFTDSITPNNIWTGNVDITLASATADHDSLSSTFANNLGSDATTVFSADNLSLSGTYTFTFATPFLYDPTQGTDLIVEIIADTTGGQSWNLETDSTENVLSRTYETLGSASAEPFRTNLPFTIVPTFTYSDAQVPEPTTLMIWGGLGLGLAFSGRRRRA